MFSAELKKDLPKICGFFEKVFESDRLSNAYLFTGFDEQLKYKFALHLTKLLNCSNKKSPTSAPCESCSSCLWINNHEHPELPILLEPDSELSKKGVVLVKQAQALLERLSNKSAFHRVIIIPKSENNNLPSESANSLLKTIEEPHPKVTFILMATDAQKVLPTILSRCQQVNFPAGVCGQAQEDELGKAKNLIQLISEPVTFLAASKISEKYAKELSLEEISELLGGVNEHLFKEFHKSKNINFLYKMNLTEATSSKIASFCSVKHQLAEYLWKVSQA